MKIYVFSLWVAWLQCQNTSRQIDGILYSSRHAMETVYFVFACLKLIPELWHYTYEIFCTGTEERLFGLLMERNIVNWYRLPCSRWAWTPLRVKSRMATSTNQMTIRSSPLSQTNSHQSSARASTRQRPAVWERADRDTILQFIHSYRFHKGCI